MERRLAAILAADVVGYTHLTERNDETAMMTLQSYCGVVEEKIAAHSGRVFNRAGDCVMAEFPSIVEAIRCAVDIQHEIANLNRELKDEERMEFRIGVSLGDIIVEDGGMYGTGVNLAARLQQLAKPGGVCVSQSVYDQVRKIVEIVFEDIGEVKLKNIADPVRVYRIVETPVPPVPPARITLKRALILGVAAAGIVFGGAALLGVLRLPEPVTAWIGVPDRRETARPSIAVMPFDDMSATNEHQYLADGVTEELITGLAKFPDLDVVARNSTFAYQGKPTDIRQVGKELGVYYVVEGSIQRSDQDVRVTAQLIDAVSGRHVWAERYDRRVGSIFDIRDDITRAVAATVMGTFGKLAGAETARLATKNPKNFSAYDNLMKGWFEWHKFAQTNNTLARDYFQKAIAADGNYAYAYTGLAWTYSSDYDFGWTEDYEGTLNLMMEAAAKAVSLDNTDYKGHWALGWAYLYSRQQEKALASYQRARGLNPYDAELLAEMANVLIYTSQAAKAVEQVEQAIRLNPFHETWYLEYLGWAYEEADMPEKAIETLKTALKSEGSEEQLWVMPSLAAAYADPKVGNLEEAHKVVQKILALDPSFSIKDVLERSPYQTKEAADRYASALRSAGLPE
ncbi:adenylate/guanylate cyclase domain-containing protein [Mesorhizobium sp. YM1C-6-2]|uniref:adenylate/guanylate cyclase domain-containing protein n=1 Tax=Mesorhizobium sp. YM1C-6-2 TaxID=1827501 RepID=UPI0015FF9B5A|nr:adenylate/guanylate cyclase domain-containing protein [Mesorhizobium sp. YM1C-6-2]